MKYVMADNGTMNGGGRGWAIHAAGCKDLAKAEFAVPAEGATLKEATQYAIDDYAWGMDLFDGKYDTIEAARPAAKRFVKVKPCAKAVK